MGENDHGELPGILRLSHPVELKLLNFIIAQLDRELISHNTIMAGHKKRVDNVLQKGHELLEVSSLLRKEKMELEEKLLDQLLELQRRWKRCQIFERTWILPSQRSFL